MPSIRKILVALMPCLVACRGEIATVVEPVVPAAFTLPVVAARAWEPEWTDYVVQATFAHSRALLRPAARPAAEIARFCPGFDAAGELDRAGFFALFLAAVARYESAYDPGARLQEAWADPETGEPEVSEGLLQLSYSDHVGHPDCALDRAARNLRLPDVNLACGVAILRRQLAARDTLFPGPRPYYWAVLTNAKVQAKVRAFLDEHAPRLPFCRVSRLMPRQRRVPTPS